MLIIVQISEIIINHGIGGDDMNSEILILAPPENIKPETIEISEILFAEAFCDEEISND